ncbi:MAG: glycosyltransferase family 2 protein [Duncaniella sp.]|nr:glycosyltransferase family 2 protein [Duncaniella sp.]
MDSPITIVIPVYNRAHIVRRTLDSVARQTLAPAHIVIVDNNSTDTSLSTVRDWASGRHNVTVLSESTPGACAARNCGLRAVSSEWTMFFDSDDVMSPRHVEEFTRAIEEHPGADVIGRDVYLRSLDGSRRRLYFRGGDSPMFHHLFRGCLSSQRFIARTRLFREAGGWNESLPGWDDFELGVRVLLKNPRILTLGGEPSVTVMQQEQSLTGLTFTGHPERWERSLDTIHTLFASLPHSDTRTKYLRWLDARAMILAAQYESESRAAAASDPDFSRRAHTLSTAMRGRVLARTDAPGRMKMIYLHNLRLHRLTWLVARAIL